MIELWPYYSRNKYLSSIIDPGENRTDYYDVEIKYDDLVIPFGFQFNIPLQSFIVGVKAGISFNYMINPSLDYIGQTLNSNGEVFSSDGFSETFTKYRVGYYGGISLGYKKGFLKPLSLDINYSISNRKRASRGYSYALSSITTQNLIFSIKYLYQL